jgi:DNA-nicking Smr family endonuclease
MDFGEILDRWNGQIYKKDPDLEAQKENPAERRRRRLRKSPDGTIDLHGLTRDEAWNALEIFFNDAKTNEFEKLLIIHGKGNHSSEPGATETGVLKQTVRDFIERCPFAGENGYSSPAKGGTGSTWVLLKASAPGK